jgi:hypothetical protein
MLRTFDLNIGKPPSTADDELRRLRPRGLLDNPLGFLTSDLPKAVEKVTSAAALVITKATAALGSIATDLPKAVPPLDATKDVTVPLDAQLSGKNKSFGQDGAGVTITCKNCSTTGSFGFHARFRAEQGQIKVASLDATTPRAFSAQALVRLQVNNTVKLTVFSTSIPIFTSQLQAVLIPDILELGPKYEIGLGMEISAIAGDLDVIAGGRVTVPASSTLRLDMLSQDKAGAVDAK